MTTTTGYCTYIYRESEFGVARYVGKGRTHARAYSHLKGTHNKAFAGWLKNNTPFIKVIPAVDNEDAVEMEIFLIAQIGRIDTGTGTLFNHTDGGDGNVGWVMSEETRAKISAANAGNNYCIGRVLSEETKAKLSAANAGNNNWLGKKHSAEAKQKIGRSNKGKLLGVPKSPETRAKMSKAKQGSKVSEETKAKARATRLANKLKKMGLF